MAQAWPPAVEVVGEGADANDVEIVLFGEMFNRKTVLVIIK